MTALEDRETLLRYRLEQAEETLEDAQKMLSAGLSPRSVTNRAYYAIFYAVLALFLKTDVQIKTSKHSGVITTFDKEFVHTGKVDKGYSKMLHKLFDLRQVGDYKELSKLSAAEAEQSVRMAAEFLGKIKTLLS
jgi:uncharacterized protein (UPF0332 family)